MIGDLSQLRRIEQRFPFLGKNGDGIRDELIREAAYAVLPEGRHVCQEGTQCAHLALVLSGTARIYKLGESGREITLYRVEPGQSCVLTASCILSNTPFPAFAICEDEVEAVVVPTAQVRRWVSASESWRNYLFGLLAARLTDIISVVEEVVFRRMDRRIAAYLVDRARHSAEPVIRKTHQEIASELGTSREVVSRILKEFEIDGALHAGRGCIRLLDMQVLENKSKEA